MNNQKLDLQSEARRAVLRVDATEKPRLVLLAINGPSQYLMGVMGPLGLLLLKTYFITVTDRSIFFHRGPRLKNSPEELVHVVPLDQAGGLVSRVKFGSVWHALFLHFPGDARPTRLNISFHSRLELDSFLAKIRKGTEHSTPEQEKLA